VGVPRGVLLALCTAAMTASVALAHDSHSPPGAPHRWLPDEEWVMAHWIPFDEARLYSELGVDEARVFDWLLNDHRTIADLAERRGVRLRGLAGRLLANRRPHVTDRQYRILKRRANDVLTQGHLAQHTLFHLFHGTSIAGPHELRDWWGVSLSEWRDMRLDRLTPNQIARRKGRDPRHIKEQIVATLVDMAGDGVHRHATDRAEARLMLARQVRLTNCWMKSPLARYDHDNPFGDRYGNHGPHERDSRGGLIRKKPPRGCWLKLRAG
jgi:hypothetical protein